VQESAADAGAVIKSYFAKRENLDPKKDFQCFDHALYGEEV